MKKEKKYQAWKNEEIKRSTKFTFVNSSIDVEQRISMSPEASFFEVLDSSVVCISKPSICKVKIFKQTL